MDENQIFEIDIDMLQPNPLQPRGLITPDSLIEIVDSIREHGVLEPLVVAKTPAGYQIIAGERRWRASKIAGLSKVPVLIKETTPQGMLEMAIIENVQRIDLNPLERAQAFKRLMEEFGLSTSEIAVKIGKSAPYVSNTFRLLSVPDALKDALASGATSEGHVRALASLDDPHLIVEAYKEVLQKNLSVRGAEELARKLKARENIAPKQQVPAQKLQSDELEKFQEEIAEKLNNGQAKVKVKISQSRVEGRIQVIAKGKVEETFGTLKRIRDGVVNS
ncbi:MAG: Chromosome segregation DNA-binding protein [Candidatus Curtissbacteria bacterium GW2011_GWA1_41_11]|uniref:Chromosome segregation DNA-binding protein n=1 Tax=Candidatus Curtissbacteria bacterium GW2011_GWA1_41_11 TaxID=1618409 RepID=A0A0G0UBG3_9BACT|nr:MAG: Chromosome segregation DNA-binding protein [Candidatus Curtissbacteria bacterium GW2011_GWA1_41_11]